MTTELTKAAQQALEQLEFLNACYPHKTAADAIAALQSALTQRPAAQTEREAFELAMKDSWQMVDPLRPPTAGSYYAGEHVGICAALKTVRANFDRHWQARASLPAPQQATPEPVPAEQAKWCEYVAGMVDCWVSAEWSNYHHKDEDRRIKAIAGIIERRLWALQKQPTTPEPVTLGPLAKRNIFDAIRGAYDLGYNDARNARTVPGDSAPGYDGRSVEEDHGGALFNTLSKRLTPATPEPVAWLVSLPDEPELGEWFSEEDMSEKGYTSKPLFTRPAPGVPEGFALVPVEPTPEMKAEGIKVEVYSEASDSIGALTWAEVAAIYRAMLAAAQAKGEKA